MRLKKELGTRVEMSTNFCRISLWHVLYIIVYLYISVYKLCKCVFVFIVVIFVIAREKIRAVAN